MSKGFMFFIFLCLTYMAAAVAHLPVYLSRYHEEERYLHARYLIGLILTMLIFGNRVTYAVALKGVDWIINLPEMAAVWDNFLPQRQYKLVYLLLSFLLSNILYLFVIGIFFGLIRLFFAVFGNKFRSYEDADGLVKFIHLPWTISALFYEINDDGEYHVNSDGFTIGLWAGRIKWVFPILAAVHMLILEIASYLYDIQVDTVMIFVESLYLLPAFGFIFFEQIQYFLEGNVVYESGSVGAEKVTEVRDGKFALLFEIYKEQFKQTRALIAGYKLPADDISDALPHNDLVSSQVNTCSQPEILYMMSSQLRNTGIALKRNYTNALASLLDGSSINIRDQIQGEFLIYLAVYMNFYISQEKTFLVVCRDRERAAMIQGTLTENMNKVNRMSAIWRITTVEDADNAPNISILICSYTDLVDHELIAKQKGFFADLYGVILTDGLEFCSMGNVQKNLFFSELNQIGKDVVYILLTEENNDSIRTAFEYYMKKELVVFEYNMFPKEAYLMLWREESAYKIQRCIGIGTDESPFIGTALPISLVAIRNLLPEVQIFAKRNSAYRTYEETMRKAGQEVRRYLKSNANLDMILHYNKRNLNNSSELEMQILYDSDFNLYNLFWTWIKYGGQKSTMIHVVSPAYMMREYFAANLESKLISSNDFEALVSYDSGLLETRLLSILLSLCNTGMDAEELYERAAEYGWDIDSAEEILTVCINIILKNSEPLHLHKYFSFKEVEVFNQEEERYDTHIQIRLTDSIIRQKIQQRLRFARLSNISVTKLPILADNVYNYYLRGQVVPIEGRLNLIKNIRNGVVYTEHYITDSRLDYYQASEFTFHWVERKDTGFARSNLKYDMFVGKVTRTIYGYWESNHGIDFINPGAMHFIHVTDPIGEPLRMDLDDVRILRLKLQRSWKPEEDERVALLAAFMFQELFKTLFPYSYQNLFAVMEYQADAGYWDRLMDNSSKLTLGEKMHSIVPFACHEEKLATQTKSGQTDNDQEEDERAEDSHAGGTGYQKDYITMYIVEFTGLEMGMVSVLQNKLTRLFKQSLLYLEWYLKNNPEPAFRSQYTMANTYHVSVVGAGNYYDEEPDAIDTDYEEEIEDADFIDLDAEGKYSSYGKFNYKGASTPDIIPEYLNLGGERIAPCFAARAFADYCRSIVVSYEDNVVREPVDVNDVIDHINESEGEYCTFCQKLTMFYEKMSDGRCMCPLCKEQQLTQEQEIEELYLQTRKALEQQYHISLPTNVNLRMKSADSIRRECKTPEGRVLGFYNGKNHDLWIESRGPKNAVRATIIHELTHAWQFSELDISMMQRSDPAKALIIMEGHASFMEVEGMRAFKEAEYADKLDQELQERAARQDVYGVGYKLLRECIDQIQKDANNESSMTSYEAVKQLVQREYGSVFKRAKRKISLFGQRKRKKQKDKKKFGFGKGSGTTQVETEQRNTAEKQEGTGGES